MQFVFDAVLFRWDSRTDSAYYLVEVPAPFSAEIREIPRMRRGFGSVRVEAGAAGLRWRTSIFPDAANGTYHLPIKRAVRDAAHAGEGDALTIDLRVLEG
ncbi:DUF1905 domain-containing protein [Microbacterium caowuchunii]|uniref:DUF1905 domain-containing protein n=1 Tax=Microbacterium caowuchunii TaxID=2614638 RepID=A0A5N0TNZ8_9MICO|nr:DUF1905 domain-containing protein [Microbacterium caowuchunii]KAA9135937.1 DUF1905 domain-containing protein [Microbacterium caowuchunii]